MAKVQRDWGEERNAKIREKLEWNKLTNAEKREKAGYNTVYEDEEWKPIVLKNGYISPIY